MNKTQAFEYLINRHENGLDIPHAAILELARLFAPKVPTKKLNSQQWASLACANKNEEIRTYLWNLYANNNELVGCDGCRLHLVKTQLNNGNYCKKTFASVYEKTPYPQYQKVLISENNKIKTELNFDSFNKYLYKGEKVKHKYEDIAVAELNGVKICVNLKYFNDTMRNKAKLETIYTNNSKTTLQFEFNDQSIAVLMPMDMNKINLDDYLEA